MAFGKGRNAKEWMRRSVEIGRLPLNTQAAEHPLSVLRAQALPLSEDMARAVWMDSAWQLFLKGKDVHDALLAVQSASSLNSVWAESRRMVVAPALIEQAKRRRRHLFGLLRHARANTPPEVAEAVGLDEVERVAGALDAAADGDLFVAARTLGGPVVEALAAKACAAYPRPSWSAPRVEVAVTLDHRSLRCGGRAGYVRLLAGMTRALQDGRAWSDTLLVAAPAPRGAPVALRLRLSPIACQRALRRAPAQEAEVAAITVSIGEREAVVRAVLARRKPVLRERARYVVARDFGYRHTAALAVVDLGQERDVKAARAAAAANADLDTEGRKSASKAYLQTHTAPEGARVVDARVFSGAGFMARLAVLGGRIDALRSEIDRMYLRIGRLKATVNRALGADPRALVAPEAAGLKEETRRAHARLFKLLDAVGRLKAKRLALYAKADGVKRSWLGFVSNQEAALAARWNALAVSEDLDVVAPEKGSPEYKGRAFNRMINAGCKGRYKRLAAGKLDWAGTPRLEVPSFYTSTTDIRHGVVEKSQRTGDVFKARRDGARMHADVHAAAVIGLWPFLTPKVSNETIVRKPLFVPSVAQTFGKGSPVF